MAVPLDRGRPRGGAGQADLLDQARHPAAGRPADPPGRRGRAARPARAPQARRSPPRACSTRERKKPLPFLPRRVGLICGRGSAAEKDVVENARRRWPAVVFEIRQVAVQGPRHGHRGRRRAARAGPRPGRRRHRHRPRRRGVRGPAAVQQRGPGPRRRATRSPPSSAPSATTSTPRCWTSSPTSGRPRRPTPPSWSCPTWPSSVPRSAPPAARLHRAVATRVASERRHLALPAQPAGAWPTRRRWSTAPPARSSTRCTARARHRVQARLHRAADQVGHLRAQVRALSPLSTLERGYAVVQHADGRVVMDRRGRRGGRAAAGAGGPGRLRRAPGQLTAAGGSAGRGWSVVPAVVGHRS